MEKSRKVLIWDTSSLSHAFEDYSHSCASAYMSQMNKIEKLLRRGLSPEVKEEIWRIVKRALLRRHESEHLSRTLLSRCDDEDYTCYIPEAVYNEIYASRRMFEIMKVLRPQYRIDVERRYRGKAKGFSEFFKAELKVDKVSPTIRYILHRIARKYGYEISHKRGKGKIHIADLDALALTIEREGTLVTADRNLYEFTKRAKREIQREIYRRFGRIVDFDVIYTMG